MFRSIRWTLQMWHAAILASVLVVFGSVVFYLLRVTTYQHIERELTVVADGVHPVPRFPPRDSPRGESPPLVTDSSKSPPPAAATAPRSDKASSSQATNKSEARAPSPAVAATMNAEGVPPGRTPREFFGRGRRGESRAMRFEPSDEFKAAFEEESDTPYYYAVFRPDGSLQFKSKFAPDGLAATLPEYNLDRHQPFVRTMRRRGEYWELVRQSRRGSVVVGRSIAHDLAALNEEGWLLAAAGVAVLAGGLAGGHWFSRRAIKPIEAISATAAEISLSNLSRRIDVTGTETELTGLARTLNQMFDRLESAFSQQVRFTADASHELRTPVAVILSHAELALEKARPAEELRETIETCRRSAARMKSLIESLLILARFDSGELQVERRPFDLARSVSDCVSLVRPLAQQRGIVLETKLEPATVEGDPDRIAQVITNLLTNAIRYNRDKGQGQVVASIHTRGDDVILEVADTGIGIAPEHLEHLFERFYRVDKSRSRKDGGVGLGLAICKSIVDAHGGQISISSEVGRGTTFAVRLPKPHSEHDSTSEFRRQPESAPRAKDVVTAGSAGAAPDVAPTGAAVAALASKPKDVATAGSARTAGKKW